MSGEDDMPITAEDVEAKVEDVAADLKRHEMKDEAIHAAQAAMDKPKSKDGDYSSHQMKSDKIKDSEMSEPVNVYTNGNGYGNGGWGNGNGMEALVLAALVGGNGFGNNRNDRECATTDQLAIATAANTAVAGYNQLSNGQQTILTAVGSNGSQNLLATCGLGDRLSTQVCEAESNIVNNIGSQAGSIRAEISNLSLQSNQQFASLQLQAANDKFDISRQLCEQNFTVAQQFSAAAAQACANQNALQMQIQECCCKLENEIKAVTTARLQDELDACRLKEAIGEATAGNGQTINQIAVSLGAIVQTLAALQSKTPTP